MNGRDREPGGGARLAMPVALWLAVHAVPARAGLIRVGSLIMTLNPDDTANYVVRLFNDTTRGNQSDAANRLLGRRIFSLSPWLGLPSREPPEPRPIAPPLVAKASFAALALASSSFHGSTSP